MSLIQLFFKTGQKFLTSNLGHEVLPLLDNSQLILGRGVCPLAVLHLKRGRDKSYGLNKGRRGTVASQQPLPVVIQLYSMANQL